MPHLLIPVPRPRCPACPHTRTRLALPAWPLPALQELLSAMAKPEHLEAVKACVGVFARDVVGTYLAGPSQQLVAAAARPQPAAAEPPALRWAGAGDGLPEAGRLGAGCCCSPAWGRLLGPTAAACWSSVCRRPVLAIAHRQPGFPARRLSRSIQELFSSTASAGREQQGAPAAGEEEAAADTVSPCASSASGEWQRQLAGGQGASAAPIEAEGVAETAAAAAAGSDIDSDVLLLHPSAVGPAKAARPPFSDSGHSQASSWAVRTPPGAGEAAAAACLPQLRRVQQQSQAAAGGPGYMQRTGSGNLEWISAVGKEWLNVSVVPHTAWLRQADWPATRSRQHHTLACCGQSPLPFPALLLSHIASLLYPCPVPACLQVAQHPQGRSVMVELAGAAAKEAAAGVSAALADRLRLEWMLVAAFALLLLAWLMQRMMAVLF